MVNVIHFCFVVNDPFMEETKFDFLYQRLPNIKYAFDKGREHVEEHVNNDDNTHLQVPVC